MFRFHFPKDDAHFAWTNHIKNKMLFYGLSEQRIRRVLKSPKRKEEGIAPGTFAAMQSSSSKKKPEEIWIMYKRVTGDKHQVTRGLENRIVKNTSGHTLVTSGSKVLMISAWRYPGISKPGTAIPIPDEVLAELKEIL